MTFKNYYTKIKKQSYSQNICNFGIKNNSKYRYSNAQTQNKGKLLLVNKHLAKTIYHWHTINGLIVDSAFLSLMLLEFLLHI